MGAARRERSLVPDDVEEMMPGQRVAGLLDEPAEGSQVRRAEPPSPSRTTSPVHRLVLRGRWYYLEHDQVAHRRRALRVRAARWRDAHAVVQHGGDVTSSVITDFQECGIVYYVDPWEQGRWDTRTCSARRSVHVSHHAALRRRRASASASDPTSTSVHPLGVSPGWGRGGGVRRRAQGPSASRSRRAGRRRCVPPRSSVLPDARDRSRPPTTRATSHGCR